MSRYLHKSHNVTVLLYHLVFPAKYRRAVIEATVDQALRDVCLEIEARYQLKFLEIGTDEDHVHFLVQSVPTYSVTKLVTIIKSLTAREVFRRCPEVRKRLWGGEFWTDGYFASTVGRHGNEKAIGAYQRVDETRLQRSSPGSRLTTSIAASVPVATARTTSAAPSSAAMASRRAEARARNSLGVPAPTSRRMTSPRL